MITNISIERILPHPDNPRKDLGDLTELAGSIKAKGILQNLTVVPLDPAQYKKDIGSKRAYKGNYIAVIGHRRHAAAKLVGLDTVPCVVAFMDEMTQISTMLLENIQRSDLTYLEQAQGFQMMLNLGENVAGISEKTGFSRSTVRSRIKLLEYEPQKIQNAMTRGATLFDFAELDKVKDPELRNEVLDTIGTRNFKYALKTALKTEEETAKKASMPTEQYQAEETEENQKNQQEKARIGQLSQIAEVSFALRMQFVNTFSSARNHFSVIADFCVRSTLFSEHQSDFNRRMFHSLLGLESAKNDEQLDVERISALIASVHPEYIIFIAAYVSCGDSPAQRYHDSQGNHMKNETLDFIYEYLERLGYEISDAERSYMDGTHLLFSE